MSDIDTGLTSEYPVDKSKDYAGYSQATTTFPMTANFPEKVKRDDFKKEIIKGVGNSYYFSYKFGYRAELTLEPCLNGFDAGLYIDNNLAYPKKCTDFKKRVYKKEVQKGDHEDLMKQDLFHTQERSSEVWNKGIDLVNELLRTYKNEEKIRRMGLKGDGRQRDGLGGIAGAGIPGGALPYLEEDEWKKAYEDMLDKTKENLKPGLTIQDQGPGLTIKDPSS